MSGRAWDNMRKGILFGLCLIIVTLCIAYGIIIKAAGSGTGFYIIWFAIAGVCRTWCNHILAVMEQDTVWNPYYSYSIVRYFPAFICDHRRLCSQPYA